MTSPSWTSTAPSGVSFGGKKTNSIQANYWAATLTCWWGRSGAYVWIKCEVKFAYGQYGYSYGYGGYPKNAVGHNTNTACGSFSGGAGVTQTRYVRYNDTTTSNQNWVMNYYGWTTNIGDGSNSLDVTLSITGISAWTVAYRANLTINGQAVANPQNDTKYNNVNLPLKGAIANQSSGGTSATATITGNANGGTWSGSNGSAGYVTEKTTYTQSKWNTAANGSGTNYALSATYTTNAALTIYAIWTSSTVAAYGTSYTLPSGTPTKAAVSGATITVTFNPNGGRTTVSTRTATQTTTFTFSGWWTSADNSGVNLGNSGASISRRVTSGETVYAHYTAASPAATVRTPQAFQCTRPGHILLGWSESSTSTTLVAYAGKAYAPESDITLYAVWAPLGLPIYYKDSSGTIYQVQDVYAKANDQVYNANVYINKDGTLYLLE